MKQIFIARNRALRARAMQLCGTMPTMQIYATLADEFDLSEDRVRAILRTMPKTGTPTGSATPIGSATPPEPQNRSS